ncbi:hypothetical protein GCM10028777_29790 [Angustibacter speluncae]
MPHAHAHVDASAGELRLSTAANRVLLVVVALTLIATVVGMVAIWPHGGVARTDQARLAFDGVTIVHGTVEEATAGLCPGLTEDRLPDGSIPEETTCAAAQVRLGDDAPDGTAGDTVEVQVPILSYQAGMSPGDAVLVGRYDVADDPALEGVPVWVWVEYDRQLPLALLAVVFTVLVVLVGRLRGLAAVLGLGVGYATVFLFMLPALSRGEDPVLVALLGSVAIMTVILYAAHGFTAKTTAALVGTVAGLGLTAALATWATRASHLDGSASETAYQLRQVTGLPDLSGLVLCGVILAGLGVLNDVTITQSSAVWELRRLAPQSRFRDLFRAGMRIGRDHLASTVYTIAFAYAGAALPTLLLISVYDRPFGQTVTSAEIAEEVVRTLVGSIGLVLAIPLTTAVAALLVLSARRLRPADRVAEDEPETEPVL